MCICEKYECWQLRGFWMKLLNTLVENVPIRMNGQDFAEKDEYFQKYDRWKSQNPFVRVEASLKTYRRRIILSKIIPEAHSIHISIWNSVKEIWSNKQKKKMTWQTKNNWHWRMKGKQRSHMSRHVSSHFNIRSSLCSFIFCQAWLQVIKIATCVDSSPSYN